MDVGFIISYSWLGFLAISTFVLVFFWKDYYFIYNHRLLYVVGLVFSRSLTSYAIITVLVWYFTDYGNDLVTSAVFFNIQGSNISQDVLKDLVNDIDTSQDRNKTRSLARAAIWSRIAYVSGAISAIMWVTPDAIGGVHSSWSSSFLICMITMTITSTFFCKGHNIYHQGELTKRPVEAFFRVFLARIKKQPKRNTRKCCTS
nr:proton-dependent oligopeptide transporter family [Tanacetum cinerariifolium]